MRDARIVVVLVLGLLAVGLVGWHLSTGVSEPALRSEEHASFASEVGPRRDSTPDDGDAIARVVAETAAPAALEALSRPDGPVVSGPVVSGPVVSGSVLDAQGLPCRGARVGVFALVDGVPAGRCGARGESDEGGSFAIPVVELGDCAVVAHAAPLRPAALLVSVDESGAADLCLRLETGFTIAGRVHRAGAPVPRPRLTIDIAFGTPGLFGLGEELFWIAGRVERKRFSVNGEADGAYALRGLGPHRHQVEVDEAKRPDLDLSETDRARIRVVAPNPVVDFDLAVTCLVVHVTDGDRSIDDFALVAETEGGDRGTTREGGGRSPSVVAVDPGRAYWLEAAHPSYDRVATVVGGLSAGEARQVVMRLSPRSSGPDLVVTPFGADAASLAHVGVRFEPLDVAAEAVIHTPVSYLEREFVARRPDANSSSFVVPHLPHRPGRYRLRLDPAARVKGTLVPHRVEVVIPAEGTVPVALPLIFGGGLHATSHAADGSRLTASFKLTDGSGRELPLNHVVVYESHSELALDPDEEFEGIRGIVFMSGSDMSEGHEARSAGPIPPGVYTLTVEASNHPVARRQVEIAPGVTAQVDVILGD